MKRVALSLILAGIAGCPAANPVNEHPWDGDWKLVTDWPEAGITTQDCLRIQSSQVVLTDPGCDGGGAPQRGAVDHSGDLLLVDVYTEPTSCRTLTFRFQGTAQPDGTVRGAMTCTVVYPDDSTMSASGTAVMSRGWP